MRHASFPARLFGAFLLLAAPLLGLPMGAYGHCDTMNGPVVRDARRAIEAGDVAPVLKWVGPGDEAEVRTAFERTMRVRGVSEEVREWADLSFFETVVRLHRMSEGMAYTGLKPATSVAPAIAAADEALETGSADALVELLTRDVRTALAGLFAQAHEAGAHADHSVEAGRAFVQAYVRFTHLAEAIDTVTKHAGEPQGSGQADAAGAPAPHRH